jgi:antitoxin (DNA-binding transcriptional repressor) of toxin-antitoxin stability system
VPADQVGVSVVASSVVVVDGDLCDLDPAGLLAALSSSVRDRRLAQVRELVVLATWAAVHSGDPEIPRDQLVQVGGEGTPLVQEFGLAESALARGTGVTATVNAIADTLDLIHRLPEVWAVCVAGEAEVGIARRVAKLSRHLPADRVRLVDRAVARIIAHESGGRVLAVAEAKIIEADPALHEERAEAERRRRYVSSSRTDEFGLRTVIARVEAGDAVWVEAIVVRVAQILAPRHPHATADELRSIAFGWLARPAELLTLLLEHRDPQDELDLEPDEPSRATAFPADLLEALRAADLSPLAPKAVLYVHLHEAAVHGAGGIARVEGLGPVTLTGLQSLLARTALTVKPVLDLSDRVRTTAYEHPESLKERVHLVSGGDYWPYATSTARNVDYDHPIPFRDTGPPGQTGTHNSGPLGRRHHRWKTHAGYRSRQCGAGRYVWLTPHGLGFLVDARGTRRISTKHAHMILDAPPGVDIYPG